MKGWRLTSTAGGDTSHTPPTHARSDCAKAFSCCRLASRPSPRDSRRRQPTVAAAAHARLAQSYAVCSPLMASRHAPTHSCDANMRLGPVTARRRRQAVTRRQTLPSDLAPAACPCATRSATETASASTCVALEETNATHTVRVGVVCLQMLDSRQRNGVGGVLRAPHSPRAAANCALAMALAALTWSWSTWSAFCSRVPRAASLKS